MAASMCIVLSPSSVVRLYHSCVLKAARRFMSDKLQFVVALKSTQVQRQTKVCRTSAGAADSQGKSDRPRVAATGQIKAVPDAESRDCETRKAAHAKDVQR